MNIYIQVTHTFLRVFGDWAQISNSVKLDFTGYIFFSIVNSILQGKKGRKSQDSIKNSFVNNEYNFAGQS